MTREIGEPCPECGGSEVSWSQMPIKLNTVMDGRLSLNETTTLFALGCDECSETLVTMDAEEIAIFLNGGRRRP